MFISPEELRIPQYVKDETLTPLHQNYKETADLEAELPGLDVLYMTRIQQERFFNEEEYLRLKGCYQLDEAALAAAGVITYGSNVKEVTTQVTEGSVDAGVVYCTDAYSAGLTPVDEATKEMCGQVIYPAAVLKAAPNAETAKEFLAYLQTDKAMTVFEGVGFSAV